MKNKRSGGRWSRTIIMDVKDPCPYQLNDTAECRLLRLLTVKGEAASRLISTLFRKESLPPVTASLCPAKDDSHQCQSLCHKEEIPMTNGEPGNRTPVTMRK